MRTHIPFGTVLQAQQEYHFQILIEQQIGRIPYQAPKHVVFI